MIRFFNETGAILSIGGQQVIDNEGYIIPNVMIMGDRGFHLHQGNFVENSTYNVTYVMGELIFTPRGETVRFEEN